MSDEPTSTVYHEWNRSRGEVTRLVRQKFNGHDLLHLRIFYLDKDGALKPTAKGVTIPHDEIAPLRKALRKAKDCTSKPTPEAKPVEAKKSNKKSKRKKKSGWGASSKSETPPWE